MSNYDEQDDIPSLNRKDTEHKLPLGWVVFYLALVAWGIYYIYAYMPAISDWTQSSAFDEETKSNVSSPMNEKVKP